ncbi:hypothetical protein [Streptomyces virginiae]|uniref:hypothetical protein n=1 Tax=Streptomyces virginiae TaxID=1961 RepID=UPI003649D936
MIPSDTRLALIDRATDLLGDAQISPKTYLLCIKHLRRQDLDVRDWHRCADLAVTGALTHHQARLAASQLVATGLLERRVHHRRRRGDKQFVEYRLTLPAGRAAQ